MNATERLIQHVLDTRYSDLSDPAITAAKTFFLDTIGVSLAGSNAPVMPAINEAVSSWGNADQAAVIGFGNRLPAGNAALLNGFQAHSQEFDCVHEPAVVHPLASIQSGLLAYCERQGEVSGKDLILALCLGVDVSTSIGMAAKTGLRFFRPAAAGVFGVTTAIAKLAGLNQHQCLDAFGLALMQSSGTMQAHVEGKPTLAFAVGMAARAGLQAVDLALAGLDAPHDVLEGPFGYFPLLEGEWDIEPVWAELGKVWRITQVSHKPFPSGRATHGGIDGIQQLKQQGLQADQVAKLELIAPPLIHQLVGRPLKPEMVVSYARLCFQFVGAIALTEDTVDVPNFYPERLTDPAWHELGKRIAVIIDDNPDPNALGPQRVVAQLHDSSTREVTIEHTLGSPANPLSRDAHLEKFRRCWGYSRKPLRAENAEKVIAAVDELENCRDICQLLALVRPQ